MSNKIYFIEASSDESMLADAFGDIDVVSYVARALIDTVKDTEPDVTVRVLAVEGIGANIESEAVRTVLSLTADGDTVATVLKSKLAAERKRVRSESEASDPTRAAETSEGVPSL